MPLSERDLAFLALESAWPRHSGMKEETIRRALGVSPARYYQLLDRLLDSEEALEHDPLLVGRLRRRRTAAAARRRGRTEGFVG